MANKKSGAEIFWECLIDEGVEVVFGYPGAATLPLYGVLDAYAGQIRHVLTRHEQGATHMADGYARTSGKVGVALATSGPGATNMVGAIATAMRDASPIVCITGQVSSTAIGSDAFQEVDMVDITEPITKHNYLVETTTDLAETIADAFDLARTGRPGPVLVDIPKDILTGIIEFVPANGSNRSARYAQKKADTGVGASRELIHGNMSAAIGASFYRKNEEIWVVESNTSTQIRIEELATMVQENANVKVIVVNSNSTTARNFSQPDYYKLAQAYGMPGYRIRNIRDIFPVIHLSRAHRGPVLIESTVEIYDLYAMLAAHPVLHQIFRRSYAHSVPTKISEGAELIKIA